MVVISKVDLQNAGFAADTLGRHPELDKLKTMVSTVASVKRSCTTTLGIVSVGA